MKTWASSRAVPFHLRRRGKGVAERRNAALALLLFAAALGGWAVQELHDSALPSVQAKINLQWPVTLPSRDSTGAPSSLAAEDAACARCHAGIVASYAKTAMARASGYALEGLVTGNFAHADSGVLYRVFARGGDAWLSFQRQASRAGELSGEHRLVFYIGSNVRGRTYLYSKPLDSTPLDSELTHAKPLVDVAPASAAPEVKAVPLKTQLWFEAPINWYAKRGVWDMAPAYEQAHTAPLALPVDANCLHCHASAVREPLPEARNAYPGTPFAQPGIGCAACHGDAAAHVASGGRAAVVNPDKLTPVRRDSVCLQCHLEGDAVVYRPGKSLTKFLPGDDIGNVAAYFVNAASLRSQRRATSEYEALLRSACRRGAGDRLTCTSCHDPHRDPTAAERVQFYRGKCLACHTAPAMATTHHAEQPDCAICHMPTRATSDISHEQMTDHDIEARLRRDLPGNAARADLSAETLPHTLDASRVELVPVGSWMVSDRERGLAYAQFAARNDHASGQRALGLLESTLRSGHADAPVHEQLGFLRQLSGDAAAAEAEYRAALAAEPHNATVETNLAVLLAGSGRSVEAMELLDHVAAEDPSQTAALLDLAAIQCGRGMPNQARHTLQRALLFNPDDPSARRFLETGQYAGMHCRWDNDGLQRR